MIKMYFVLTKGLILTVLLLAINEHFICIIYRSIIIEGKEIKLGSESI